MFDSHCHLNHQDLIGDLAEVVARAHEAGVTNMVVVGSDLQSSRQAIEIAESAAGLWAAVGVHPHEARFYDAAVEAELADLALHPKCVAIGEIGLDYHYDFSPRADQHTAFAAQLALASAVGLPVVVHCREAHEDVLCRLESSPPTDGGVLHCWSGTPDEARRTLDLGLMIGIAGVVTFKKRGDLGEIVRSAPLDRLVIETDAPYLAPVPVRGRRNEPRFLPHVCARLADDLGLDGSAVAEATDRNARRLYRLPAL
jgi:TatD DNase family protein